MSRANDFSRVRAQQPIAVNQRFGGRTRIMEYGPSVGVTTPRVVTNVTRTSIGERGVVRMRVSPGVRLGLRTTTKSAMSRKVEKGIRQPGLSPINYVTPMD